MILQSVRVSTCQQISARPTPISTISALFFSFFEDILGQPAENRFVDLPFSAIIGFLVIMRFPVQSSSFKPSESPGQVLTPLCDLFWFSGRIWVRALRSSGASGTAPAEFATIHTSLKTFQDIFAYSRVCLTCVAFSIKFAKTN